MRKLLIDTTTVIAALCALSLTILVARREILGTAPRTSAGSREPVVIEGWDSIRAGGHHFGSPTAAVTVVEFGDFECPACKRFAPAMRAVLTAYPDDVKFVYRHWPLPYHRFARPAARAFECATAQSIVEPLYYLLYEKQDSLGLISFTELATRAGVSNIAAFEACNASSTSTPAVDVDMALALRLPLHGTPAIIVNGLYLNAVPDSARLDKVVQQALRERSR